MFIYVVCDACPAEGDLEQPDHIPDEAVACPECGGRVRIFARAATLAQLDEAMRDGKALPQVLTHAAVPAKPAKKKKAGAAA